MIAPRRIGPFQVGPIGLGCMSLSYGYGAPVAPPVADALLARAVEIGVDFFDTATLYGGGENERVLGRALKPYRSRLTIASKGGMRMVDGKREIDGSPDALRRDVEASLARLQVDVIDLYYLHRLDRRVPVEDSVGALGDMVRAGKLRAIGLSEVSGSTLRRAHAVHPIAAVQNEYSLWTREPEIGVIPACRELGIALVAFSPLARSFLCDALPDPAGQLQPGDLRLTMPRFDAANYPKNLRLLAPFRALAAEAGCTTGQLALAWLLAKEPFVVPIPGTARIGHLEENLGAANIRISSDLVARLDALINNSTVAGGRYNEAAQRDIDTETFPTGGSPQ